MSVTYHHMTFITQGPWQANPGSGSTDNKFNSPRGCCTDGTSVYITDTVNNRIIKRAADSLAFIAKAGTFGLGDDNFRSPSDIATDNTFLYIVDKTNDRIIKRRCSDLVYVSQVGSFGAGPGQFKMSGTNLGAITADSTHFFVYDGGNLRIQKFLSSNMTYVSEGSMSGIITSSVGLAVDDNYIYINDLDGDQLVVLDKTTFAEVNSYGTTGSGNDNLNSPLGITIDDTYIYIADSANGRIMKRLKSDLSYVSQIGIFGSGGIDTLFTAWGICNYGNYIYITDSGQHFIQKRWKQIQRETGTFYVIDTFFNTLQKRDLETFALLDEIGSTGDGDDQFSFNYSYTRSHICNDGNYIYVSDSDNNRIKKHSAVDLSFVDKTTSLVYSGPSGICTTGGKVFFIDWGNYSLVTLDANDLDVELGSYFVNQPFSPPTRVPGAFLEGSGLTTDGTNIWSSDFTTTWSSAPNDWQSPMMKFTVANIPVFVTEFLPHESTQYPSLGYDEWQTAGILVDGDYVYLSDFWGGDDRLSVRDKTTFAPIPTTRYDPQSGRADYVSIIKNPYNTWRDPVQVAAGELSLYIAAGNGTSALGRIVQVNKATFEVEYVYWDASLDTPTGITVLTSPTPPATVLPNSSGQVIW